MRASLAMIVRRRASVGWAVRTRRIWASIQKLRQLRGVDPVVGEKAYGLHQRAAPRSACGHFAVADAANSLAIFREIDELEVVGEGANQGLGLVVRKTSHQCIELDPGLGIASTQILRECARRLGLDERRARRLNHEGLRQGAQPGDRHRLTACAATG